MRARARRRRDHDLEGGEPLADTANPTALDLLIVCARFPPLTGGTEIHVAEVSARLAARGHRVRVLTTTVDPLQVGTETWQGVEVTRVRAHPRRSDLYVAPALWGAVHEGRPDVVHVQGYHTFVAPLAMLAARHADLPYVVTFHSGGHSSQLRRSVRPIQHRLLRPLLRRAELLIAVSNYEATLFQRRLKLPADHFVTIPNGVSQEYRVVARDNVDRSLITTVGRLERYKGHHRLIQALRLVRERVPDARLRVIGQGSYERELRALSREHGVEPYVEFCHVAAGDHQQMATFMASSAVIAFLSAFESQGMAAREALATGARLLVNDSSALAELGAFANVRVVQRRCQGQQLADILVHELLQSEGNERFKLDGWDDTTDALEQVYHRVLPSRAGRAKVQVTDARADGGGLLLAPPRRRRAARPDARARARPARAPGDRGDVADGGHAGG